MKLVQDKETLAFSVLESTAPSDEYIFMGKFDEAQLRSLRKSLNRWIDAQPLPELPSLKGILDEELVETYISVRDAKDAYSKRTDMRVKMFKDVLEKLSAEMLSRCNERGSDTIKITGIGTATRKTTDQAGVADWVKFYEFLYAKAKKDEAEGRSPIDMFSSLYKRINGAWVSDYKKENEDMVPPGVNVVSSYEMSVRRATDKSKE